jgi:hypothetical protein
MVVFVFEAKEAIDGSDTMLKSNGPNSISKDALRDEDCPWLINCTTQEYLVNVGQDSHFNIMLSNKEKSMLESYTPHFLSEFTWVLVSPIPKNKIV